MTEIKGTAGKQSLLRSPEQVVSMLALGRGIILHVRAACPEEWVGRECE